ncbi:MerR family transcriptional regulator [Longispora fulva]|uniref:DNA-binding transcriptional MerR regulator n=1 Tax=Longispora fulva TaxID=619741 RepID=A0A8J7GE88_9ACTN|nr:MerR family transcriptional regulator [Longispora fulva]MBG6134917.1 DNA-binding transcriptional MerR regulator [Longispora fulva]
MTDDLVPIGAFARLCRLSVKQLRHYDGLGLLTPARVDRDTGYRYYRPDQARDALVIGLLRSLDVPLAVIGQVLSGAATEALGRVRDDLESELARRRRGLATLERVLAHGLPTPVVSVVTEPAHRVLLARDVADGPDDIGRVTSSCVARLLPGLDGEPRLIGLFPLDVADQIPVAVAAVRADGDDLLPGGTFASATHVGPYDQITLTAHALLSWCAAHGHPPTGPIREVYVSDPATTPPDRLVTHLMIPLEESS